MQLWPMKSGLVTKKALRPTLIIKKEREGKKEWKTYYQGVMIAHTAVMVSDKSNITAKLKDSSPIWLEASEASSDSNRSIKNIKRQFT